MEKSCLLCHIRAAFYSALQYFYFTTQFYYKKEDVLRKNRPQYLQNWPSYSHFKKLANFGPFYSKSQDLGFFMRLSSNFSSSYKSKIGPFPKSLLVVGSNPSFIVFYPQGFCCSLKRRLSSIETVVVREQQTFLEGAKTKRSRNNVGQCNHANEIEFNDLFFRPTDLQDLV
jgi:hypothetical protein